MRIEYKKYPVAIEKNYDEIELGDVIRVEYGDYGNIVDIVVISCEVDDSGKWVRTLGKYVCNGDSFEGLSHIVNGKNIKDVIGKAVA